MKLPPLPLVVLDTETTGFVPKVHRIIEFASMRAEGGEVTEMYEQLFSIPGEVPPQVQVLTRIKPAELVGKPTFEQCKTAFVPEEMAVKICEPWKEAPRAPNARLSPNGEQTEVLVSSATTEDLRAWNQKGQSFPPGYKRLAEYLRPGITVYRFTFVEPGKTAGLAFDALFFLDGKWFFVPKPWRGLRRGVREAEGK